MGAPDGALMVARGISIWEKAVQLQTTLSFRVDCSSAGGGGTNTPWPGILAI